MLKRFFNFSKNTKIMDISRLIYKGFVDEITSSYCRGWAWNKEMPDKPVMVDIYEGDEFLDSTPQNTIILALRKKE